jgi:hypothetical protein
MADRYAFITPLNPWLTPRVLGVFNYGSYIDRRVHMRPSANNKLVIIIMFSFIMNRTERIIFTSLKFKEVAFTYFAAEDIVSQSWKRDMLEEK